MGLFFSGLDDLLYKEEEILDGDSADVSSPRDSRWFDHETLCPVVHTLNKTAFWV